jgi:AcrR family transcriptional regulator
MKRKRLSRVDSRELTTQRLLDAAQKLFAKKGFEAVSVETVSEAAGYSRGAFYSNFDSKEELFFELIRRDHQRKNDELNALIDDSMPIEQVRQRVNEHYSQLYRDNESCMNWTEARMLAARDARFRVRLNALIEQKRQGIAGFIQYFYQRVGVTPPIPPNDLAMGFMSLAEGIKLYLLSSPTDLSPDTVESILKVFVDTMMELAHTKASRRAAASPEREPAATKRSRGRA